MLIFLIQTQDLILKRDLSLDLSVFLKVLGDVSEYHVHFDLTQNLFIEKHQRSDIVFDF